jgi:hypothetical protein
MTMLIKGLQKIWESNFILFYFSGTNGRPIARKEKFIS